MQTKERGHSCPLRNRFPPCGQFSRCWLPLRSPRLSVRPLLLHWRYEAFTRARSCSSFWMRRRSLSLTFLIGAGIPTQSEQWCRVEGSPLIGYSYFVPQERQVRRRVSGWGLDMALQWRPPSRRRRRSCERVSPMAVMRMAASSVTGHSRSQIPQPMQSAGST